MGTTSEQVERGGWKRGGRGVGGWMVEEGGWWSVKRGAWKRGGEAHGGRRVQGGCVQGAGCRVPGAGSA